MAPENSTTTQQEVGKDDIDFAATTRTIEDATSHDFVIVDRGAETALRRTLSSRHLSMIALASSIGMGLWLGSGQALSHGGPAAIFLGYCLAGCVMWSVAHSIGEMAIMYPLPAAFVQWTGKFVDPAAAFALGWGYWFAYLTTIANELQAVNTVVRFWTHEVPVAAWIVIAWSVIALVNVGAVRIFGEIEVVSSTIKFSWIIVAVVSLIVISAGGAPNHEPIGFRYWNSMPFTHGFKGFLGVLPSCIFAMSGSENSALVAAETRNPRRSIPRAVNSIWVRLTAFYILGCLAVTITVSPKDPNIFGGTGTNASPFVIAYRNAGIPVMGDLMNVIILLSVISTATISAYGGARMVMGLAYLGMAPNQFTRADNQGRPWYGLIATLVGGLGLGFLNVNHSSAEVFSWLASITNCFTLFGWGMICLTNIRFRKAWSIQGNAIADLPWKSWTVPYSAWFGLVMCIVLLGVEFFLAVWPLGQPSSAKEFFARYVSVIVIVVMYIGAKFYYKGPRWVDLSKVDLDTGRRFYAADIDEEKGGSRIAWIAKRLFS